MVTISVIGTCNFYRFEPKVYESIRALTSNIITLRPPPFWVWVSLCPVVALG